MSKQDERMEQLLRAEADMMEKHGFVIHYITQPDDSTPTGANIHTHGLKDSFDHPDIQIVLPLGPKMSIGIMHNVVNWIKAGNKIELEKVYDRFVYQEGLIQLDVVFAWAVENDRDVLRMIFPDREGALKEDEMDEMYKQQWGGTSAKPQKTIIH